MKLTSRLVLLCSSLVFNSVVFAAAAATPFAPTFLPVVAPADAALLLKPDRDDWTYPLGTTASLRLVLAPTAGITSGLAIKYRIGPEMREGAEQEATLTAQGLTIPVPSPAEPGFVRCIVTATVNGKATRALATVAFSPEKIQPTQTEPADFDQFWKEQKEALAKIAPDYQVTPAPELSTAEVEVSYVSFQNVGGWAGPTRFYGVLCVPRGPGPFPAVLSVPGAGVRPYSGLRHIAQRGVITLQVGIHGIPVNLPKELYDQLGRGALANYPRFNLDDRFNYYYRRVYLGCLRANDFLVSQPKWDQKNLVVMGGSQGGQLSIVTAALDSRVTALAASYPAYSDVTGYLRGRTGGWPALFRASANGHMSDEPVEAKVVTTTYYDTVNFARRLKVPGFYFWGYNDETCPPTSTFAAYNVIGAPKQLQVAPEQGHSTSPQQQAPIDAWVLARFK